MCWLPVGSLREGSVAGRRVTGREANSKHRLAVLGLGQEQMGMTADYTEERSSFQD